ncbi:hypothetical protein PHYC_02140 [Phycisphaerales bacterium]|nr:hypothetical protein PHYC_02140 [Phycisphaerales bacterium]
MHRKRPHPAIASLLLVWLCISTIVLPGGLVVCRGADGEARVEWGCVRTVQGECATACVAPDADDHSDETAPCDDEPLVPEFSVTKASQRIMMDHAACVPVAIPVADFTPQPPRMAASPRTGGPQPPETLKQVRSVILLV